MPGHNGPPGGGSPLPINFGWCYLGTAKTEEEIRSLIEAGHPAFDHDGYKILVKVEKLLAKITQR